MKALVVSGGGSRGAYAGGLVEYFIKEQKKDWDIFLGTSTGSLLTPLLSIDGIEKVKKGYLSVSQEDIFSFCPFKVNGDKQGKIKFFRSVWRVLRGDSSIGDSSALERTIRKNITPEDFDKIQKSGKKVGCCVSNLTRGIKEYKFADEFEYEDYIKWIHASSAVPPIMSVIEMGGESYADGGIVENTPIQKAIDLGATEIDVVILSREKTQLENTKLSNVIKVVNRIISMMLFEISTNDVLVGKLSAGDEDVHLNLYYPKPFPKGSAMVFNKQTMKYNWDLGRNALASKQKSVTSENIVQKKIIIPAKTSELKSVKF